MRRIWPPREGTTTLVVGHERGDAATKRRPTSSRRGPLTARLGAWERAPGAGDAKTGLQQRRRDRGLPEAQLPASHPASHDDARLHDAQCAQLHSYLDVNTRNGCSICTSGSLATPQPRRLAMRKKSPTSRRAPGSSRCAVSHADQHTLQVFRSPLSVKPSRRGGLVRRADSWKFRTLMNGSARSRASHPQPRLSHTALLVITHV